MQKSKITKKDTAKTAEGIKVSTADTVANGPAITVSPVIESKPAVSPYDKKTSAISATSKVSASKTSDKASPKREKKPKKEMEEEVYFQFDVHELKASEVSKKVKEAYKASGHRLGAVKTLDIYVNAAEGTAYYVVNGKPGPAAVPLW